MGLGKIDQHLLVEKVQPSTYPEDGRWWRGQALRMTTCRVQVEEVVFVLKEEEPSKASVDLSQLSSCLVLSCLVVDLRLPCGCLEVVLWLSCGCLAVDLWLPFCLVFVFFFTFVSSPLILIPPPLPPPLSS